MHVTHTKARDGGRHNRTTPIAVLQARSIIGSGKFPSQANQDEHAPLVSTSPGRGRGTSALLGGPRFNACRLWLGLLKREPVQEPVQSDHAANSISVPRVGRLYHCRDPLPLPASDPFSFGIHILCLVQTVKDTPPSSNHSSKRSSLLFHTPFSVLFENFLLICLSNLRIYKPFRVRDALPEFSPSTSILSLISNSVPTTAASPATQNIANATIIKTASRDLERSDYWIARSTEIKYSHQTSPSNHETISPIKTNNIQKNQPPCLPLVPPPSASSLASHLSRPSTGNPRTLVPQPQDRRRGRDRARRCQALGFRLRNRALLRL